MIFLDIDRSRSSEAQGHLIVMVSWRSS